ncbi:MAG: chemotaxis protein CheW [Gammaproteobacteria bacterium]
MTHNTQLIKSIILTLKNKLVVVPNAAVAEIISVQDVRRVEDSPRWLLGNTRWRGVDIPIVSYEAAAGEDVKKVNLNTQVAVIYSASDEDDRAYPYFGLAMHGVPHVSTFTREQIKIDTYDPNEHPMVAQVVRINGAAAGILDIPAIEKMLQQAVA